MKLFLEAADVAAEVGLGNAHQFLSRRRAMERDHDFPAPMPHILRPLLWRASEVRAWVGRQGLPPSAALDPRQFDLGNVVVDPRLMNLARSA